MSQALYRQYRPQRFSDVVGQDVAVRTLRNAIEQDRVAHAYLFTGTKGTGKTTLAKLLAKAMNCENGPTIDPCGTCEACMAIAEGRSMDVAEIDAASSRGIDDVREKIIDTVAFQPSHGTRRVYILDEAHQLTPAAFNALLKTIEEPPAHVIFVFCTTEAHQMMATVRDRCQRIAMRPPGPEALVEVQRAVSEREGIQVDDLALRAVSRAASGSFRNALGTLEMLVTTFGPAFTRDDVLQHLGVVSEDVLFDAADATIDADAGTVLRLIERLVQDGVDLEQFARALAEHLRSVLLQIHGVGDIAMTGDEGRLVAQAGRADERRILATIDCLADAVTRIRVGSDVRIAVETALVRACQGLGLPLLSLRLAALEQKLNGQYGEPLPPAAPGLAPTPTPTPEAEPGVAEAQPSDPAVGPLDVEALRALEWWPSALSRLTDSPALRPMLAQLRAESCDGERLALRQLGAGGISDRLRDALATAVHQTTGVKLAIDVAPAVESEPGPPAVRDSESPSPPPRAPRESRESRDDAPPTDEGVANLMSMFDATPVPVPGGRDGD